MNGLSDIEVIESRKKYGSNSINIKSDNRFIKLFIKTLGDPIIKIMLIALAIRFIMLFKDENWFETLGMLISIFLSSLISSLSEYGSNKSFDALQKMYEDIKVSVKRDGKLHMIKLDEVVVGDIVYLSSGDAVPADGYIIDGCVNVDEASLTGESKEITKNINDTLLRGSVITNSKCIIKVNKVGVNTVYGNIAKEISSEAPISPMRIRLTKLAKTISKIGYIGGILASISFIFNKLFIANNFNIDIIISLISNPIYVIDLLISAVTLIVTIIIVCVPEGLPMMVALVLSSNMKKLLKNNVLVRKAVGIEASGSMNVLLTDKTGTLTEGNMSVIGIITFDNKHYNTIEEMNGLYKSEVLTSLIYNNESYYDNKDVVGGNSTDRAILKYIGQYKKELEILDFKYFNSNDKYSSVFLSNKCLYSKGATEVLIDKCDYYLTSDGIKKIIRNKDSYKELLYKYTTKGIRVISIIKDNIFIGYILLRDKLRDSSKSTLKTIKDAGIHVIMITGDDINTASSIANDLELINNDDLIIDHDTLINLDDDYIINNYKRIKVIARALPSDKSRIATILENNGLVVGMTGDGVNDAPALKKASVGISLGSGSEVAKEASDLVILDDNIKSIETAILYGRTIFKSIRKFIIFQLTMNFIALILSIIGPVIGFTTPITIMQMLWINMIMDTLAGLAYSYEVPLIRYMKELPIKKNENILNKYMYSSIIVNSLYCSIILIIFLISKYTYLIIRNNINTLLTGFFSLFVFFSIFNAFNARSERINILSGIHKNKVFLCILLFIFLAQLYIIYFGGTLFRTFGLNIKELLFILIISTSVIIVDMIRKLLIRR